MHRKALNLKGRVSYHCDTCLFVCLFVSVDAFKAPLYTKLTLMDRGIGNTNLLGSSFSGLGYDCFYMKSTDGATIYFNLGSGIGSGRFQTDY